MASSYEMNDPGWRSNSTASTRRRGEAAKTPIKSWRTRPCICLRGTNLAASQSGAKVEEGAARFVGVAERFARGEVFNGGLKSE